MRIQLVPVAAKQALAEQLGKSFTRLAEINVSDLRLDAVMLDLYDEADKAFFGIKGPFLLKTPPYAQQLDVLLRADKRKAAEFRQAINAGSITFLASYGFNKVSLDFRQEVLESTMVNSTRTMQNLQQSGALVMTAEQIADAASQLQREITSTVIPALGGTIQPQSLPVERLMELFEVKDAWKLAESARHELEQRWYSQLSLDVDKEDFQPFEVQKHVIDLMNSERSTAEKRQQYLKDYQADKKRFSASAKAKYSGAMVSASGQAGYEQDVNKVADSQEMSDDQFSEFVRQYHGVEYDTQEKLYRGLSIYDVKKLLSGTGMRLVSVTVKPLLVGGVRNLPLRPNAPGPIVLKDTLRQVSHELGLTPVGTVVMWWGRKNEVPDGWEICNGEPPSDQHATLMSRKPDLQGKFVQGAEVDVVNVTELKPEGHSLQSLKVENLPDHIHHYTDAYWAGSPYQGPPKGGISKGCPPGMIGFDGHWLVGGPGARYAGLINARKEMKLLAVDDQATKRFRDKPSGDFRQPSRLLAAILHSPR